MIEDSRLRRTIIVIKVDVRNLYDAITLTKERHTVIQHVVFTGIGLFSRIQKMPCEATVELQPWLA